MVYVWTWGHVITPGPLDKDFVVAVFPIVVSVAGGVVGSGEAGTERKLVRREPQDQQGFHVKFAIRSTAVRRAIKFTCNPIKRYLY